MFLPLANLNQKLYLKQWFLPNRAANINLPPAFHSCIAVIIRLYIFKNLIHTTFILSTKKIFFII